MGTTPMERAVRTWLTQLDVERGVSRHTLTAYARDSRRYLDHLRTQGVTTPEEVTEAHVSGFLAALRTGDESNPPLAASSAARSLTAVRGLHRFLALEGETRDDPARDVAPPAPTARLPKAIRIDEITRLLDAAGVGEGAGPLRARALLEVLYGTGARISEAVGLGVDETNAELTEGLRRTRGGRGARALEMDAGLAQVGIRGAYEGALRFVGNPELISRTHFAR